MWETVWFGVAQSSLEVEVKKKKEKEKERKRNFQKDALLVLNEMKLLPKKGQKVAWQFLLVESVGVPQEDLYGT